MGLKFEELFESKQEIKSRRKEVYSFIDFGGRTLLLAQDGGTMAGINIVNYRKLDVCKFEPAELKEVGIWKKLSKEIRDEVENRIQVEAAQVEERMEKARAGRRKKYDGVPREAKCTECGKVQAIPPAEILKRAERMSLSPEAYVKQFKCQKCNPTKGRRPTKDYSGVPDHLECKCGKVVKYHPSMIVKQAEAKGMDVKKYVESYQCQKCCPSKRKRKKKK
jgi:hypothetical protein